MLPDVYGLDLGYGALKLYGRAGGIQLPSHVAAAQGHALTDLAGLEGTDRPLHIDTGGQAYFVGAGAHAWGQPIESLDYDRLTGSPEIVALLYGAFSLYMEQAAVSALKPITLYVGLPLEPLSVDPAAVQETLEAVRKWLCGVHVWAADGINHKINVGRVEITSQPAAAYFDYILTGDGRPHPGRASQLKSEVGVISIGFNTLEIMVVQNGRPVQRFTGGSTTGVRRFLERLNDQLGGHYSLGELDTLLRQGQLNSLLSADSLQSRATDEWLRQITGQVEKRWGTAWRRFAHTVIVGGGAILLNGRLLHKFGGRASVPDEPVLAISRGLYKLALAQERG
jgi:hypothetical protein